MQNLAIKSDICGPSLQCPVACTGNSVTQIIYSLWSEMLVRDELGLNNTIGKGVFLVVGVLVLAIKHI